MSAEQYARFLRPRVAELLAAIDLDVVYVRGEGDWLWTGDGRKVLDLCGGFGASLFGHNHPELVAALERALAERRPFNAQASVRAQAGGYAARLAERVHAATGRDYIVTLASTGTEAVEAAIKHAELEAGARREALLARIDAELARVEQALRLGRARAPEGFVAGAARALGLLKPAPLAELPQLVRRAALAALDRPPLLLALESAFHGKSTGALSLTHSGEFREPWHRLSLRTRFLPPGDEAAVEAALRAERVHLCTLSVGDDGALALGELGFTNVVAALAEPIQGEGGIRELSPVYLAALRAAADEHGFPLVLDEIQCGLGRTGRFLACEAARARPDYVVLSKALGGGLVKLSALLVARERYQHEFGWLHTSTFADDDLSAAVGLRALELADDALCAACRDKGERLLARLRAVRERYPHSLRAVRGRGLMIGLELGAPADVASPLMRVLAEQQKLGFLAAGWLLREHAIRVAPTLSSHQTLRVEPSAFVDEAELDRFAEAVESLAGLIERGETDRLLGAPPPPPSLSVVPPPAEPAAIGVVRDPPRVGFLAHFLAPADLRAWEPRLGAWSDADAERFLDRAGSLLDPFHLKDARLVDGLGDVVDVTVVAVPFLPAQVMAALRDGREAPLLAQVRAAVELCRRAGAGVVGFGGYTSIVTANCTALAEGQLAFTSGNSLTAAAAVDGLFAAAREAGIDAARATLGVAGALGNIGAVLAELAAERVGELLLVGRPAAAARLEAAAEALRARGVKTPVRVAADLGALAGCELVISATNSPRPIIEPRHLAADRPVVVADVAAPADVSPAVAAERPNARVLAGGVVRLPAGQTIDLGGVPLADGRTYGCLAETLLLGLEHVREHFSYGALDPARVRRIGEIARRRGFRLG